MLMIRTDLAVEALDEVIKTGDAQGVVREECQLRGVTVSRVRVLDEQGEAAVGKSRGTYVTVTGQNFASSSPDEMEHVRRCVATELTRLTKGKLDGGVLVVGLGNNRCTPDALGPRAAARILVSRHMHQELSHLLDDPTLTAVSSLSPGVLGQTGMETGEVVRGVVERISPSLVIAVDALAARSVERLGTTVQLADVGLAPGSGVGNKRAELTQASLGVPVVSIGVPTVVDAGTLAADLSGQEAKDNAPDNMIVTPREIDLLVDHAARLLADGINRALYPGLDKDDLAILAD